MTLSILGIQSLFTSIKQSVENAVSYLQVLRAFLFPRNAEKLYWQEIIGFAFLALALWVIVQNNENAKQLGATLISQAQTALVGLFANIGTF